MDLYSDTLKMKIITLANKLRHAGFFHIFGASVVNKVVLFLSGIVLVRILTKPDYGTYSYAWNILCIALVVNGLGSIPATLQLASETNDRQAQSRVYSSGLRVGLLWDAVLCTALLLLSLSMPFPVEGSNTVLALFFAMPVFVLLNDMQQTILRTQLHNKEYSAATNINTLLVALGTIGGAFICGVLGLIVGRYIAFAISILIVGKVFHIGILKTLRNNPLKNKRDMLKISLVSVVNEGLSQFSILAGTFFVGYLLNDPSSVASYQVATVIPTGLNFIPSAFVVFIYPYFARHMRDRKWVRVNFVKALAGMTCLSSAIAIPCILFAEPLIALVFGTQYSDSVVPFQILCLGFVFNSTLRSIAGNLMVTQRKLLINTVICIVSLFVLLILLWFLIPQFGLIGAAMAQTSYMLFSGIAFTVCFTVVIGK